MTMSDSQKWLWFAGLMACLWLLYHLAPVFTPFLIAALFAYLGDPLVDRLEEHKLSRTLAVSCVFLILLLVLILVLLLFIPMVERQITLLLGKLPGYVQWVQQSVVPWLSENLGIDPKTLELGSLQQLIREHWQTAGGVAAQLLASVSGSGLALLGWLASLVLIPVVTFYLLRDWDILVARVHALMPRQYQAKIAQLARESDEVLGAFLRGQLLVMLVLGTVYSVGLWLVGLDLALLIGMLAGLVSFVPYLGFILGVLTAGVAILVQTQELFQLLPVLLVFGVGQALEGMVLTPLLVGDRIGLHPVAVIFAVLAGGQLFGFFGILLALPAAAVVAVLLRHAHGQYLKSRWYDDAEPPE